MSGKPWLGLTDEEWLEVWDQIGWRGSIARTLIEIARDPRAGAENRLLALQTLSEAVQATLLPVDPMMPRFIGQIMLSISLGTKRRWLDWGRRRHERESEDRLTASRWMIRTASQFVKVSEPSLTSLLTDYSHLKPTGLAS